MTRLQLIKQNSNLTKSQKMLLSKFLLKSLTWGVCHNVSNDKVLSTKARKKRLYKFNKNFWGFK